MKTKIIKLFACMIVPLSLITAKGIAQQQLSVPSYSVQEQPANEQGEVTYTYSLFVAPNKMYGYNIFKNGRIIFHQPAMSQPAGSKEPVLAKKEQADKAATIAVQKLRRGMPGELSGAELLQVTAQ